MSQELNITGPNNDFEEIKEIDNNGIEFWRARKLFPLLGYSRWETFEEVIRRAMKSALNSGQITENHFRSLTKMVDIGSNTKRMIKDWKLDRYACYLIAQNGDSKIPQIAQAQTYFAVQTRRQEIFDKLSDAEKRLFIRGEVTSENKKLFKTAKQAGVSNFGLFNDAGYKGLYGSSLADVEMKKGIKKGELLDRAGSTELAANLFRITQTDEKINKDKIKGDFEARKTHFMVGGKVRQTIKDIGGELPENLKSEKHIKDIKKDIRLLKTGDKLLLKNRRKK
jgi:DNA-damage-inducible protein D